MGGWQQYAVVDGNAAGRAAQGGHPPGAAVGLSRRGRHAGRDRLVRADEDLEPKAGQTIVVSAASGAVGSVVGQLAKARGCRAVGIAGGPEKCRYVVDELGFDACIDYKAHADTKSLYAAMKEATPDGVDGYFENVGGAVLDVTLARMNAFGRIALCGMISGYNGAPIPLQQPQLILQSRLTHAKASSSASTWRSGPRR